VASSDIVVVGAGIVGCAIGYELARRGASVQIVDERTAGGGATQASAGVLAPFIEAREGGPLLDLTARSLDLFDKFVARVSSVGALEVPYARSGTLDVATSDQGAARLRETSLALAARAVASELLDARTVREQEPHLTSEAISGLVIPSHGFVGAEALTNALVRAARQHGAQLVEHRRVRRIAQSGPDLVVDTDRGPLQGSGVVLAAGTWSGRIEIAGVAPVPVRPIRGQLLQLGWTGRTLRRIVWGERCYMVPWSDGTVLVGATVEDAGFEERTTLAGARDLIEAACELTPHAWTASLAAAKVGLRPACPDGLPVIGASSVIPNLMYATGHYRNGVLLAPLTAHLVADVIIENLVDPMLEHTRPQRFGRL
jgi:glycine oxidase